MKKVDLYGPDFQKQYQSIIGSLMYAMLGTRPDLAYAVSSLSQYCSGPTKQHMGAAKRVLRYLSGTRNFSLKYDKHNQENTPIGYSDSDWAGDADRRSTGGFVYKLAGGAISWKSKKQTSVALSTLEAEYMAASEAAKEAIWIKRLVKNLRLDNLQKLTPSPLIYIDNLGCIQNIQNPRHHERTKHIDIRYHFVRELVENKSIEIQHISSEENTADILTKALPRDAHEHHVRGLGLGLISSEGAADTLFLTKSF
jgi:hypothetical protein